MYHQDWLIRHIQLLVQAIARIIFNKENISYEIRDENNQTETDVLYSQLNVFINEGKINEAENLLFEKIATCDLDYLTLAIDFYQRLNKLSDDELKKYDFSREEIESGLNEVKKLFNITF